MSATFEETNTTTTPEDSFLAASESALSLGDGAFDASDLTTSPSLEDVASLLLGDDTPDPALAASPENPETPDATTDPDDGLEAAIAETEDDDDDEASDDAPDASDTEADLETDDAPAADADEALPDTVQKRIDALVAVRQKYKDQRDEARARIDELETMLAERPDLPPVILQSATESNPLASLTTEADIRQRIDQAKLVIGWCDQNPDGGEIPRAGSDPLYVTAEEVARRRLEAERIQEIHGPKRLDYLRQNREAVEAAKTVYPDLFQKSSPFSTHADSFLTQFPELTKDPNYPLYAGDWVVGALVRHGHLRVVPVKAATPPVVDKPGQPAAARPAATAAPSVSPIPAPATARSAPRKPARAAAQQGLNAFAQGGGDDLDVLAEFTAGLVGG